MVCKPRMNEEEDALCVVRDFSGTSQNLKITLSVSNTMTGKEFVQEVAKRFNFDPSSFRLVSPTPDKKNSIYQAELTEESEESLKDIGVIFEENSRNLFIVEGLNSGGPRLLNSKDDDLELGASASPEEPSSSNSYSPPLPPPMITENDENNVSLKYNLNSKCCYRKSCVKLDKSIRRSTESFCAIGYRGLVNQAMTCYLNSLLQALFMTPEFRNALYNWKFVPSPGIDESKSIPYQLQRLFLNLQTSSRPSVETTDLTRSFGWDSSEAWQQHDIQELCRVMFDALEQEFKGTEQADLINRLYQGKMIDYVKCLECETEKSREDTFLDIPLPVRPFGSSTAYGSVEEALQAFVRPELLEGNDQYFCEKCSKKCNAHKGLKFIKFPYLLTLHLMRFDFDYNTMHRIKLSDKVVFPETLNLNNFVPITNLTTSNMYKEDGSEGFVEEITGSSSKCDDSSTTDSGSAIDDESCMASSNDLNNVDYDQDIDEGIDVSNQNESDGKSRCHGMETGPYLYELFSIMVHSGSASGGHYYVYIKDFNTEEWICFNDQTVTKITTEDIDRSFGGYGGPSRAYYSGVYSSSMNAYMLMYRQIDRERNVLPFKEHEFPPHITTLLRELNETVETERKARESEKGVHRIKVFVNHPTLNDVIVSKIECNMSTTFKELTQIAFKKLQLENVVSLDQCRLVVYNKQSDIIEASLDGKENDRIESILFTSSNVSHKIEMLMEIRRSNETFPVYKPGVVPIKLYPVDLELECVQNPITVHTSLSNSLATFRVELNELDEFRCYRSPIMLLILEMKCNAEKFLEDETISLRTTGVTANSRVFVLFLKKNDMNLFICRRKMRNIVQRFLNTLKLNISLPKMTPEVFQVLSIPVPSSSNVKLKQTEEVFSAKKDSCFTNGECNFGEQTSISLSQSAALTHAGETSSTFIGVGEFMSFGGHKSDQSASEDSSLTDSERTIIGGNQEDSQVSCSSSSPQNFDVRCSNDLFGEDETHVEDRNVPKTYMPINVDETCTENQNAKTPINIDSSTSTQSEDYFFKVMACDQINILYDEKIITVQVHKRIPMNEFKQRLEPYVGVPSSYFKCVYESVQSRHGAILCEETIMSLGNLEDGSMLRLLLTYPLREGTLRGRLYLKHFNNFNYLIRSLDKFNIDENDTVEETKRRFLQDLKVLYHIDVYPSKRWRLRKMSSNGPGRVCLNGQTWKELGLGSDWKLLLEELGDDEPEAPYCVMTRSYVPTNGSADSLQQLVFNDVFGLTELKNKISELSGIPAKNLVLGDQTWANALSSDFRYLSMNVSNSDIDWNTISEKTILEDLLAMLTEEGRIIYYKDDREDVNELKNDKRPDRTVLPSRRERTLKIRVNKCKTVNADSEDYSGEPETTSSLNEAHSSDDNRGLVL